MSSKALKQYYDTDSKSFRRRFDVERMESDSTYRDSVRLIIRDSLMKNDPKFRQRVEERRKEQLHRDNKADNPTTSGQPNSSKRAIRKEELDGQEEDEPERGQKDSTNTKIDATTNVVRDNEEERGAHDV